MSLADPIASLAAGTTARGDHAELVKLEEQVEKAEASWVDQTRTLRQIRGTDAQIRQRHSNRGAGTLWASAGFSSFTTYLDVRWEISETKWGSLTRALRVYEALEAAGGVALPGRYGTACLLSSLVGDTDELIAVWAEACRLAAADGVPCGSQRAVRTALAARAGRPITKAAQTVAERERTARAEGAAEERRRATAVAQASRSTAAAGTDVDDRRAALTVVRSTAVAVTAAVADPSEADLEQAAEQAAIADITIHELAEADPDTAARIRDHVLEPPPTISILPQSIHVDTNPRLIDSCVVEPNGKAPWLAAVCLGHESILTITRTLAAMSSEMRFAQKCMAKSWLHGLADAGGDDVPTHVLLAIGRADVAHDRALSYQWPDPTEDED